MTDLVIVLAAEGRHSISSWRGRIRWQGKRWHKDVRMCTAGVVLVAGSVRAGITVDGTLNESDYGASAPGTSALATQTVASSFGSNQLDAAYAVAENGNLYLFIAGQTQNNGNAVQIWFDDGRAGGQNTLNATSGAGNMSKMKGSLFSPDFNATYALEMNVSGTTFNLDQSTTLLRPPRRSSGVFHCRTVRDRPRTFKGLRPGTTIT